MSRAGFFSWLAAVLLVATSAAGDDSRPDSAKKPVGWDPAWQPFGAADAAVIGAGLGLAVGGLAIPINRNRWTADSGFDAAARGALRLGSESAQFRARDASDALLALSLNQLLIDALVVAWWKHGSREAALHMLVADMEVVAVVNGLTTMVGALASRRRPYAADLCVGDAATDLDDCRTSKRYRSFFSGHSSNSFAAAATNCMHHVYLPLYGGGAGDVASCAIGFAAATATGTLRIAGDQHWLSDVLTGAAVGTATGLLVPWLLHYRKRSEGKSDRAIHLIPAPLGIAIVGEL